MHKGQCCATKSSLLAVMTTQQHQGAPCRETLFGTSIQCWLAKTQAATPATAKGCHKQCQLESSCRGIQTIHPVSCSLFCIVFCSGCMSGVCSGKGWESMTDLGCLLIGLLLLLGHRFLSGSCFFLICRDARHHGLHINRSLLQHRLQLAKLTLQASGQAFSDEAAVSTLPEQVCWCSFSAAAAAKAPLSRQLQWPTRGLRHSTQSKWLVQHCSGSEHCQVRLNTAGLGFAKPSS